jgi:hypothetical protein
MLFTLSQRVRQLYDRVSADDPDLGGRALLELCADLLPYASRGDLMAAIFASGIELVCNDRLRSEIDGYWQSARAGRWGERW